MCCLHGTRFDLVHRTWFNFWFLDCDLVSKTEGIRTQFNRCSGIVLAELVISKVIQQR